MLVVSLAPVSSAYSFQCVYIVRTENSCRFFVVIFESIFMHSVTVADEEHKTACHFEANPIAFLRETKTIFTIHKHAES